MNKHKSTAGKPKIFVCFSCWCAHDGSLTRMEESDLLSWLPSTGNHQMSVVGSIILIISLPEICNNFVARCPLSSL